MFIRHTITNEIGDDKSNCYRYPSIDFISQKNKAYSIVLPCIIKDTEQEVNEVLMQYKRKDKTLEEYLNILSAGLQ